VEDLRFRNQIYRTFAETGLAPSLAMLAEWAGGTDAADAALRRLHDGHALVLDESGGIRMALPFSAVPTDHRVVAGGRTWWANCAWDALAIPAALGVDATIEAPWFDAGGAVDLAIRDGRPTTTVGVDLNPGMLAVAARRGGDIDYREADAQALPFLDAEFAVAVSQFGLMFLPDPVAGVKEMARVANRGAVAVWGDIGGSDGYSAMQELFRDELGEDAAASLDAPFAMGAAGLLEEIVADAGVDAEILAVAGTGRFDSIEQWVTTEVRGWTLGDDVSPEQLGELIGAAQQRLAPFERDDGCVFGMTARIATWSS
jgi:SAM-dependent methyltransferase